MATELHISPLFESTHKPPIPACPPVHVLSRSVPQWLQSFTSRLSADLRSVFPSPINHVLVNEYQEGQGIMIDHRHLVKEELDVGMLVAKLPFALPFAPALPLTPLPPPNPQPHQDGPAYFPCVAILSLGLPGTMAFSPHQRLLECREEREGGAEEAGDGKDEMGQEEAGKRDLSGDALVMRESAALPPRSLLVFKDQAYTGELGVGRGRRVGFVWGCSGDEGECGPASSQPAGVQGSSIHR
ncbi:unnamed protein product [Closterium sp. NIES-54]